MTQTAGASFIRIDGQVVLAIWAAADQLPRGALPLSHPDGVCPSDYVVSFAYGNEFLGTTVKRSLDWLVKDGVPHDADPDRVLHWAAGDVARDDVLVMAETARRTLRAVAELSAERRWWPWIARILCFWVGFGGMVWANSP